MINTEIKLNHPMLSLVQESPIHSLPRELIQRIFFEADLSLCAFRQVNTHFCQLLSPELYSFILKKYFTCSASQIPKGVDLEPFCQKLCQRTDFLKTLNASIGTFAAHEDVISRMILHEDCLFTGSWDRNIHVWDATTGKWIETFECLQSVTDLCIQDDRLFATLYCNTMQSFDLLTGEELNSIQREHNNAQLSCVETTQSLLFLGTQKEENYAKIIVYNSNPLHEKIRELLLCCFEINKIYSLNDHSIAVLHYSENCDSGIVIIDINTGQEIESFCAEHWQSKIVQRWNHRDLAEQFLQSLGDYSDPGIQATCCQISQNHLYAGSSDGLIFIWDINKKEETVRLGQQEDKSPLNCLKISCDFLFAGSHSGYISIWNINTHQRIHRFHSEMEEEEKMTCMECNEDFLFVSSNLGIVRTWRLSKAKGSE